MLDGWQARYRGLGWGKKKTKKKRVEWHEVKVGVFYLQEQAGRTEGGRGVLTEKAVVCWQGEPTELGRRLHWEATRRGVGRAKWILVVGDGAPWIWNVAADRWADAQELLDFYHASEHLWELGRALYGEDQAKGWVEGFEDKYYYGRRPTITYIPRFRNIGGDTTHKDFVRGYGFQADGERKEWRDIMEFDDNFGAGFKDTLSKPGFWSLWMGAWGECLPNYDNAVKLDPDKKDKWGLPLVRIHFEYGANEKAMRKDMQASAVEMLQASGFKNVTAYDFNPPGGSEVHEMGTARMGKDPKTSVLNSFNQVWDAKNVFVTDGSFMTSAACVNPSLTYMAMTARAADHAVKELKKGNL